MTTSHPYRRSTDKGLTWGKAKDGFLLAAIGAVPTLLGLLYNEQTKMNKTLADLEKTIALGVPMSAGNQEQAQESDFWGAAETILACASRAENTCLSLYGILSTHNPHLAGLAWSIQQEAAQSIKILKTLLHHESGERSGGDPLVRQVLSILAASKNPSERLEAARIASNRLAEGYTDVMDLVSVLAQDADAGVRQMAWR